MLKITHLTQKDLSAINISQVNDLIQQLSNHNPGYTQASFSQFLSQANLYQLAAFVDDKVIGLASLFIIQKIEVKVGLVEGVVVDEKHRGQGIGEAMMRLLIKKAQQLELDHIDLTSNPKRIAANKLYQKLGFYKRKTNVYRLKLMKS